MNINGTFPPVNMADNFTHAAGNAPFVYDEEIAKFYEPAFRAAYIAWQCLLGKAFNSANPVAMIAKTMVQPANEKIFNLIPTHFGIEKDYLKVPEFLLLNFLSYKVPNLIDKRYTVKNHIKHVVADMVAAGIGMAALHASAR